MKKKRSVAVSKKSIVHRIADCFDCDFRLEDYRDKNIPAKAREHALKTGHTVGYESGTSTLYSGVKTKT